MRLSSIAIVLATFLAAGVLSVVTAFFSVSVIEASTEISLREALDKDDLGWAEVQANGLTVEMSGTAPSEAKRFQALSVAGSIVDAARVLDHMEVRQSKGIAPPRFSVEVLRNDSGVSIIGLVPRSEESTQILATLQKAVGSGTPIADFLEMADHPIPEGWTDAMAFAMNSIGKLPRSKVSVEAEFVQITAITDSVKDKQRLERELSRAAPPGLRVTLDISAPRPVITPFRLRFVLDGEVGHFDACSAATEEGRERIIAAARKAGLKGPDNCVIGLGVPSPNWPLAVEQALDALSQLDGGTVTFADADISLVGVVGTDKGKFDDVVGELEARLPDVFALHAVLPEPKEKSTGETAEFIATLSPEGLLQMRGRLRDDTQRSLAESFAKARFGTESVHMAARVVEGLPTDWPIRVLAGLEALGVLENGVLIVTPDDVLIKGVTEHENANADIAGLLSTKLGENRPYTLDIIYREPPPPTDLPPTPEECEASLFAAQSEGKITFEPGSATIAADSLDVMNAIADILRECGDLRLEIQGHTDSQGREVMNQQLSQARAQSVLNELRSRRILTTNFVAKGYGESQPIADNSTEEGREANRRIEFRLTRVETSGEEDENGLDTAADLAQQEASADEPAEDTAAGETVSDEAQEAATEASEPTEEGSTDEQN
jgi:OOP family OmpA-OmpF porin